MSMRMVRSLLRIQSVSVMPQRVSILNNNNNLIRLTQNNCEIRPSIIGSIRMSTTQGSPPPPPITSFLPKDIVPYANLMRLDKPTGSLLLLWPCYWGISMAASPLLPPLGTVALFTTGAVMMRGAGCTINDMWDQDFDSKVARTKNRPIPSGAITTTDAFYFLSGQLGVSALILSQFDAITILVGASSLLLVTFYPLTKRFTNWPQVILGMTFNWGSLLGWTAVTGCATTMTGMTPVIPLYVAGICWTIVYDTIYAHQDKSDDLVVGLKSTAIKFGDETTKYLSLFSAGMVTSLAMAGYLASMSWPFFCSVAITGAHLSYQMVKLDIKDPSNCWNLFQRNSDIGFIIFLGIIFSSLVTSNKDMDKDDLRSPKGRSPELVDI